MSDARDPTIDDFREWIQTKIVVLADIEDVQKIEE